MADPLSVAASVLGVATAALASVRSLCDTVKRFQNRDKTLGRLQAELQDLVMILGSLVQVINADESVLSLLESPIERCKNICSEFQRSMKKFDGKSKAGLLDWTKLEFMKGDINEFIDTIEGYKSTITVGLGTLNLRNSQVSREVLQKYEEMIKETAYNLELHLQQIDEKLVRFNGQDVSASSTNLDLQDEKAVTQQCLRICEDASSYIESLASRESDVLKNVFRADTGDGTTRDFDAQVLLRQALSTSHASLSGVIKSLGERLQTVVQSDGIENETEKLRLQEDLNVSKQCLQVCKVAREISHQKIHTIGEAVAEEDSDQIVVTTLADLFDVKKAVSRGRSAQLVATLTPENFDHVVEKRYSSRFGAPTDLVVNPQADNTGSTITPTSQNSKQFCPPEIGQDKQSPRLEARRGRANPNEMRKRYGDGDSR